MHLPGESDAGDLIGRHSRGGQGFPHRDPTGAPPVFGILFRPADLRRGKRRVFFGSGRDYAAVLVHNQGASAAGADVDSENMY